MEEANSTSSSENEGETDSNRLEIVTNEDAQAVEHFEQLFKKRYTEEDEYFQNSISRKLNPPPIVHPWYAKPRRNFDYTKKQHNHESYQGWWTNPRKDFGRNRGGGGGSHGNGQRSSYSRSNDHHPHDRHDRRQENRNRPY